MDLNERVTRAVSALHADTGFEGGAEVKTSRLHEALGLDPVPKREAGETDARFVKRAEKHRMLALTPIEALVKRLLKDHKVDLQATHRGSYRIVPSAVQAAQAERDGRRRAARELRAAGARILHTNVEKLSASERVSRDASMLNTASRLAMVTGKPVARVLAEASASAAQSDALAPKVPQPSMRRL